MVKSKDSSTEQRIFDAAMEVFIARGYDGTRMQEIADKADINKALLHYYFRSKDQLFDAVFSKVISQIFPVVKELLGADMPLINKMSMFVDVYISTLVQNPFLPSFVLHELNSHPHKIAAIIGGQGLNLDVLEKQVKKEIDKGIIRPIHTEHLLVNVVSMLIFPFVAKPVLGTLLSKNDESYRAFILERKKEIIEFITHAIKP